MSDHVKYAACPDDQNPMVVSGDPKEPRFECWKCGLTILIHPDQSESWTRHYDAHGQRVVRKETA